VCKNDEIRAVNIQNTLDHVAFNCRNQVAMCDKLSAMGVKFTKDQVPGRPIHQVFFFDPAGNGVELSFVEAD
jgi:catechol 2,3-dioxygenase-like lactoylglutathione lyase family enzyme